MPASPIASAPAVRTSDANPSFRALPVRRLWVGWHLFSLDAATVAVVWSWFFAAVLGVSLPWTALITLALGTWCVYVADRLLDGWRSVDMTGLRDRHWFYLRHRKPFVVAWTAAAIPLAYLIFFRVQDAVRVDDVILCLIGAAYFLLIHNRPAKYRFSKEFFVGVLFSIATAVPTWTRVQGERSLLLSAILMFGAACWLNCVAIQTWEDGEAMRHVAPGIFFQNHSSQREAQPTAARSHVLTDFLGHHLTAFALTVGVVALALACAPVTRTVWPLFAAVALSSLLFLTLIRYSERFSALSLRIMADAALLTPFVFFLHFR